ncbi:hypothetical protein QEV83_13455 [Methylocapsa sp. D3K7]|uniref:hypothetical protein n=1 Tax=Methylocapsa sp. D3K7 TaxID=3041435 RepID=UPI00244E6223|nr:hypothetical protein [Methylocapsa sp. D3K7]WGJ13687.1 hypothetical protein QEV83_13455 [Methylocapsa sp. D3K7]
MTVPKTVVTKLMESLVMRLMGSQACACLCIAGFWAGIEAAHAADLGPGPGPGFAPAVEIYGPVYGYFNPVLDPRCRIVPQPQLNLYGDTARFRPTAVCQSRGLYTDSVLFP